MDKAMDKDMLSKRVFYLEAALKKAWKEFNRLQKAINPEGEKFKNLPLKNLQGEESA